MVMTGLAVLVLREAGVPANDPACKRHPMPLTNAKAAGGGRVH